MDYFRDHPGRFPALHVKDMAEDGSLEDVGAGKLDFAAMFAHAEQGGVEQWLVEHDKPVDAWASAERATADWPNSGTDPVTQTLNRISSGDICSRPVRSAYARRVQNEPTVRLTAVRRLYEVSARMGAGRSLAETLQAVVDGVVNGLGFGIAVLNLRQPDGKFEVIAVAGSPEAREALLGTVSAADIFDAEFAIADEWGRLRFVPHERLPRAR